MGTTDFLPRREADLVTWINTFHGLISGSPKTYGLTAGQAKNYGTLATAFINARNIAKADATPARSGILAKTQAKVYLLRSTRQLAGIIQESPGTTDQMRSDLGLTMRSQAVALPVGAVGRLPAAA